MTDSKVEKQSRDSSTIGMFDLSKGILMVLVVVGHSTNLFFQYWEVENSMSLIMVPLMAGKIFTYGLIPMFFMMSGYGFRKQKMRRCIKDRGRYLLKPYLYVAVIVTVLAIIKKILQGEKVVEALWYQSFPFLLGLCPGETEVLGRYTASIGPLWFLVVLGISWIVLNLFFQLDSVLLRVLCITTVVAFCTRLPYNAFIPFCFIQALVCSAYLYIGYCVKKNRVLMQKLSRQTYEVLCTILILVFPFGNVEVSQNVWKLGFLDFIASCIVGFLLCKLAVSFDRFEGVLARGIRIIGKNSLYILCIHTVEYLVFPWNVFAEKFMGHMFLGIVVAMFIRVLVIGVGCFVINKIVMWKRNLRK